MTIQVIGAGLGRTGTNSQKLALQHLLGGTCHHMFEVGQHRDQIPIWTAAARGDMPDWHKFLQDFSAIVDWPGCSFWPELMHAYPDALVLLSVRDYDQWFESASQTIFEPMEVSDPADAAFEEMWLEITGRRFSTDFQNKRAMITAAKAHNERVIAEVPAERLLVWQVTEGWGPICERLNLPVPSIPFPRSNSRQEFWDKYDPGRTT